MSSSFERCLSLLDPDSATSITNLLSRWSQTNVGRVLATNINPLEHFLPPEDLREILLALDSQPGMDMVGLASIYSEECKKFVLHGDKILLSPPPSVLGRVLTRNSLITAVMSTGFFSKNRANAEDFVNRLLIGHGMDGDESQLPMSPFAAWVTWDDKDPNGNPFRFAEGKGKDCLLGSLGFDPRALKEDVILLTYRLPLICHLLRPTVADAGTFPFFEPPYAGFEDYGLTKPWQSPLLKDESLVLSPRPEAVHSSQPLACLIGIMGVL